MSKETDAILLCRHLNTLKEICKRVKSRQRNEKNSIFSPHIIIPVTIQEISPEAIELVLIELTMYEFIKKMQL